MTYYHISLEPQEHEGQQVFLAEVKEYPGIRDYAETEDAAVASVLSLLKSYLAGLDDEPAAVSTASYMQIEWHRAWSDMSATAAMAADGTLEPA